MKFFLAAFLFQIIMLTLFFAPECNAASAGSWVWVRNIVTGAYGEAVVGTGAALYIARGAGFYRYTPSNDSFVELASPPKPDGNAFKTGTALAWDFGDYIYALYGAAAGDSRRYFYRYSISQNVWERLADTPYDQGEGDAMTYVGRVGVYATVGGEQRLTHLLFYNTSTNIWDDAPADPPGGMGNGASLVWAGGDCLYALRGEFLEDQPLYDFWRYNITADVWSSLADIPAYPHDGGVGGVGDGGSLLYIGFWMSNQTDYIYALSGNQAYPDGIPDNRTYRYTISTDSWERLADLPFGIGYYVGCRLGYAEGHIYAWQGTPSTWDGGGDDLARFVLEKEVHDLSVKVILSAYEIYFGQNASMRVIITNEGNQIEQSLLLNVQLDYIANVNISLRSIEPESSIMQMFLIVTVGHPAGNINPGNYTIVVKVYPVPGEVDTSDNIVSLNFTVKPDYNEPRITTPIQKPPPENVLPFQNVSVSVNVTDYESGMKNVTLYYRFNSSSWKANPMIFNSTTSLYETVIPGFDEGTKIEYMIIAYDNAGNKAQQDNAGQYYIYTVIPEFPSTLTLAIFILTTLTATALWKIRKQHHILNFSFIKYSLNRAVSGRARTILSQNGQTKSHHTDSVVGLHRQRRAF